MGNDLATAGAFDYGGLPKDVQKTVKRQTYAIRNHVRNAAQSLYEIGASLIRVKDVLPHGQFGPWLEKEFGWSDQTALNYMAVARAFPNGIPNGLEFSPKALYLLARRNVPEEARAEAVHLAEQGVKITPDAAQEIAARWRTVDDAHTAGTVETESVALTKTDTQRIRTLVDRDGLAETVARRIVTNDAIERAARMAERKRREAERATHKARVSLSLTDEERQTLDTIAQQRNTTVPELLRKYIKNLERRKPR